MMKLGIFAKTFKSGSVEALFAGIRRHGIHHIHYNMACSGLSELPLHIPPDKIEEINRQARKHQLEVVGLSATFNMIDRDPTVRREGLKSLKALAPVAKAIGTNFISLCTGSRGPDKWQWHPDNATSEAWTDLVQTMEEAIEIAGQHDVLLGVEPETGNVVRDASLARKLMDEMASERIRIILDAANLFEQANNQQEINDLITESLDLLHDRIQVAHAKDRSLEGTVQPAGKGAVDFPFFINQLRKINFQGPLVLHGLEEKDVADSLSLLQKIV